MPHYAETVIALVNDKGECEPLPLQIGSIVLHDNQILTIKILTHDQHGSLTKAA